ncbi:hypothetical protein FHG64_02220 [Antarcticibacterium flavum]|uniref:Outer membrane protein beta-barrel domain-containing protein n=1 Tax=Antarcticibacterium flavum TaxID=2058175 RepID=A0A5B7WYP5_9FLAO|nr:MULTISPECIES: hypothetical protein [Antarcticibacterium]MCM4161192.1 hypothetical protein [Antarcticibacterium sp. W02-3]QCY68306.1 hypothetical protein FHG64_02220 [Antarcticibacterium flavum]
MKKLFITLVVVMIGVTSAYSQGHLKLGVNAGIPVGDASDYSFQLGGDLAYMFNAIPILDIGPMVGYSHFFGDDDFDDMQFLPAAVAGRLNFPGITVGLDLGYAVGLNDGNDGGFYYRPQLGFRVLGLGLIASYQGISMDPGNISSVNLGVEFGL